MRALPDRRIQLLLYLDQTEAPYHRSSEWSEGRPGAEADGLRVPRNCSFFYIRPEWDDIRS